MELYRTPSKATPISRSETPWNPVTRFSVFYAQTRWRKVFKPFRFIEMRVGIVFSSRRAYHFIIREGAHENASAPRGGSSILQPLQFRD
jgi:hypothetical protein